MASKKDYCDLTLVEIRKTRAYEELELPGKGKMKKDQLCQALKQAYPSREEKKTRSSSPRKVSPPRYIKPSVKPVESPSAALIKAVFEPENRDLGKKLYAGKLQQFLSNECFGKAIVNPYRKTWVISNQGYLINVDLEPLVTTIDEQALNVLWLLLDLNRGLWNAIFIDDEKKTFELLIPDSNASVLGLLSEIDDLLSPKGFKQTETKGYDELNFSSHTFSDSTVEIAVLSLWKVNAPDRSYTELAKELDKRGRLGPLKVKMLNAVAGSSEDVRDEYRF